LGFGCRLETVNAVEAWRDSIPGDGYSNVRRPLLHTLNLADILLVTSVWAGLRENPSALIPKHRPPLLYAATTGATPFRFNLQALSMTWSDPAPIWRSARWQRSASIAISPGPWDGSKLSASSTG
jgi:hypothetical protein